MRFRASCKWKCCWCWARNHSKKMLSTVVLWRLGIGEPGVEASPDTVKKSTWHFCSDKSHSLGGKCPFCHCSCFFFSSCFLMLRPMWFVLINDRSEEEEYVRCSKHSVASSTFVQPYSCSWIVSNSKRPWKAAARCRQPGCFLGCLRASVTAQWK